MSKPKLIDAIIGNSRMLASMGKNGEIHRLWWPRVDYAQQVDKFWMGIILPEESQKSNWIHWRSWNHQMAYWDDANILEYKAQWEPGKLSISWQDMVLPWKDCLVRLIKVNNLANQERQIDLMIFGDLPVGEAALYPGVWWRQKEEAMVHYRENTALAWGTSLAVKGYQAGFCLEQAENGWLTGANMNLSTQGAVRFSLGALAENSQATFMVFLCAGYGMEDALDQLKWCRSQNPEELLAGVYSYWQNYLAQGHGDFLEEGKIDQVYRRSLLSVKLVCDEQCGGILAAPEFDEKYQQSGGYGYCWGRDAAFITLAMDQAGHFKETEKFFQWAQAAQDKEGFWAQRHWVNGQVAPSWGNQIDETGSILWGLWRHYQASNSIELLHQCWDMVMRGTQYLLKEIEPTHGLPGASFDLWEERIGVWAYSSAAVWAGIVAASGIAKELGQQNYFNKWQTAAVDLKQKIISLFWDEQRKIILRGINVRIPWEEYHWRLERGLPVYVERDQYGYQFPYKDKDDTVDASLLGLCHPFPLIEADDDIMVQTVERIRSQLWSEKTGGLRRYPCDCYQGGNPWVLTTLWLGQIYVRQERLDDAREILRWAAESTNDWGLLPEQVNPDTGRPQWVIPLTWSQGMYVQLYRDLVRGAGLA